MIKFVMHIIILSFSEDSMTPVKFLQTSVMPVKFIDDRNCLLSKVELDVSLSPFFLEMIILVQS